MKPFLRGSWQVILGLLAALGVFLIANVCVMLAEEFIRMANPTGFAVLLMTGPRSISDWLIFGILFLAMAVVPVALGFWIARDAGKFKKLGINLKPVWWGVGATLPSSVVVLPIYFFKRHLVWPSKLGQADLASVKLRRNWHWPWILAILIVLPAIFNLFKDRADDSQTKVAVEKIHNTRLTIDDVMGKNLPPEPGAEAAGATIAGVDENKNGIRDDVELAIFKEYPNSAKTRAVLLQYALALQMEMTQEIVNTETVVAVSQEEGRASMCIGDSTSRADIQKFINITQGYIDFVEKLQFNNDLRVSAREDFNKKIGSYSSIEGGCDVDIFKL